MTGLDELTDVIKKMNAIETELYGVENSEMEVEKRRGLWDEWFLLKVERDRLVNGGALGEAVL